PTFLNAFSPMVAQDPLNPQNLVAVASATAPAGNNTTGVVVLTASFSTNGGKDWTNFINPPGTPDTPARPTFINMPDPLLNPPPPNTPNPLIKYAQATNATVAFDREENFYILVDEHNADYTDGSLVLNKFQFASGTVATVFTNHVLHNWLNQD